MHVFARVSPGQKLRIIRALQQAMGPVAMIGDGINDSPALRAADVGIALGKEGTAAAREVADVVLETDNLMALVPAVERGRTTCTNIRKSINYLLSTNLSEVAVMLAASGAGIPEALSPMQLLWINLISDVLPGLGLALEAPEPDVMRRAPAATETLAIASSDLGSLARQAAPISAGPLAACFYAAARYGATSPQVRTLTFGSLVTAQLLHAITCRSQAHGILDQERLPPNRALAGLLGLSAGAQVAALFVPGMRGLLGLAPIAMADAVVMAAGGLLPFLINEAAKSSPSRARLSYGAAGS